MWPTSGNWILAIIEGQCPQLRGFTRELMFSHYINNYDIADLIVSFSFVRGCYIMRHDMPKLICSEQCEPWIGEVLPLEREPTSELY